MEVKACLIFFWWQSVIRQGRFKWQNFIFDDVARQIRWVCWNWMLLDCSGRNVFIWKPSLSIFDLCSLAAWATESETKIPVIIFHPFNLSLSFKAPRCWVAVGIYNGPPPLHLHLGRQTHFGVRLTQEEWTSIDHRVHLNENINLYFDCRHHTQILCILSRACTRWRFILLYTGEIGLFYHLDKTTVLQEARVFNDSPINARKCRLLLTKIIYLLYLGEPFNTKEATELFFNVTKLFQSKDVSIKRRIRFVYSTESLNQFVTLDLDLTSTNDVLGDQGAVRYCRRCYHGHPVVDEGYSSQARN